MTFVLVGKHGIAGRHWPCDPQSRIVPGDPVVEFGGVERRHFIDHLGIWNERTEAVREAAGHPQLLPVIGRKCDGDMLTIRRGAGPDVYRDIEDRAANYTDQLALGMRVGLEVKATNDPCLGRKRVIVLNERFRQSGLAEGLRIECLAEKAAGVAMDHRLQHLHPIDGKRLDHGQCHLR